MYLVAMLLTLSWPPQPYFLQLDAYPATLVTGQSTVRLDGFKDMATCTAYNPVFPPPSLNGGPPIPLTITRKSCVKYKVGTPAAQMPGEPGAI